MKSFAIVFPGQGSQYPGMGKELYQKYEVVKNLFKSANEVLDFDLKKICFEGTQEEITATEVAQPAILLCSIAAYKALLEQNESKPKFAAGHSLGEYSALVASGALSFESALMLVRQRGLLMQQAAKNSTGAMAAIASLAEEEVIAICKEVSNANDVVVPSNFNSPNQVVISGSKALVDLVCAKSKEKGAVAIPLKVSAPFHSPYMNEASERLSAEIAKYKFDAFHFPVISNVTAKPYNNADEVPSLLVEQMIKAVQWTRSIQYINGQGIEQYFELGPKNVLNGLIKSISPKSTTYSSDQYINGFESLSGAPKSIVRDKVLSRFLALAVTTKNKNWDQESYNQKVVGNYNKLQELNNKFEGDSKISDGQIKEAYNWLTELLDAKKLNPTEKKTLLKQMTEDVGIAELITTKDS